LIDLHEEGVNGGFGFELAVGEVVVLPLVEEGGDLLHYGLHVGLDEISNEDKFELINKA
jgi:hypothetical protein